MGRRDLRSCLYLAWLMSTLCHGTPTFGQSSPGPVHNMGGSPSYSKDEATWRAMKSFMSHTLVQPFKSFPEYLDIVHKLPPPGSRNFPTDGNSGYSDSIREVTTVSKGASKERNEVVLEEKYTAFPKETHGDFPEEQYGVFPKETHGDFPEEQYGVFPKETHGDSPEEQYGGFPKEGHRDNMDNTKTRDPSLIQKPGNNKMLEELRVLEQGPNVGASTENLGSRSSASWNTPDEHNRGMRPANSEYSSDYAYPISNSGYPKHASFNYPISSSGYPGTASDFPPGSESSKYSSDYASPLSEYKTAAAYPRSGNSRFSSEYRYHNSNPGYPETFPNSGYMSEYAYPNSNPGYPRGVSAYPKSPYAPPYSEYYQLYFPRPVPVSAGISSAYRTWDPEYFPPSESPMELSFIGGVDPQRMSHPDAPSDGLSSSQQHGRLERYSEPHDVRSNSKPPQSLLINPEVIKRALHITRNPREKSVSSDLEEKGEQGHSKISSAEIDERIASFRRNRSGIGELSSAQSEHDGSDAAPFIYNSKAAVHDLQQKTTSKQQPTTAEARSLEQDPRGTLNAVKAVLAKAIQKASLAFQPRPALQTFYPRLRKWVPPFYQPAYYTERRNVAERLLRHSKMASARGDKLPTRTLLPVPRTPLGMLLRPPYVGRLETKLAKSQTGPLHVIRGYPMPYDPRLFPVQFPYGQSMQFAPNYPALRPAVFYESVPENVYPPNNYARIQPMSWPGRAVSPLQPNSVLPSPFFASDNVLESQPVFPNQIESNQILQSVPNLPLFPEQSNQIFNLPLFPEEPNQIPISDSNLPPLFPDQSNQMIQSDSNLSPLFPEQSNRIQLSDPNLALFPEQSNPNQIQLSDPEVPPFPEPSDQTSTTNTFRESLSLASGHNKVVQCAVCFRDAVQELITSSSFSPDDKINNVHDIFDKSKFRNMLVFKDTIVDCLKKTGTGAVSADRKGPVLVRGRRSAEGRVDDTLHRTPRIRSHVPTSSSSTENNKASFSTMANDGQNGKFIQQDLQRQLAQENLNDLMLQQVENIQTDILAQDEMESELKGYGEDSFPTMPSAPNAKILNTKPTVLSDSGSLNDNTKNIPSHLPQTKSSLDNKATPNPGFEVVPEIHRPGPSSLSTKLNPRTLVELTAKKSFPSGQYPYQEKAQEDSSNALQGSREALDSSYKAQEGSNKAQEGFSKVRLVDSNNSLEGLGKALVGSNKALVDVSKVSEGSKAPEGSKPLGTSKPLEPSNEKPGKQRLSFPTSIRPSLLEMFGDEPVRDLEDLKNRYLVWRDRTAKQALGMYKVVDTIRRKRTAAAMGRNREPSAAIGKRSLSWDSFGRQGFGKSIDTILDREPEDERRNEFYTEKLKDLFVPVLDKCSKFETISGLDLDREVMNMISNFLEGLIQKQ